ncbi:VOC family protein [Lysinibacillus capsici]|uniref:Glyoxalase/bleomycin resistance protein n=1 Tax=Lysinibacillus capsici TaxID=2115968 RepID=A0A2X0ZGR0_9BACI|nr:VOC family protein [Lysinibacillus capsici]MCR6522521.1 VOC family protein [Lysinibacillus capsici]MED3799235.1 VOC family protein [Lysinibacillus capsici]MED4554612.1 VOC family protein [Lysinibacillus capsici]WNN78277.1 VOC family protein [Lysinibacillus capsici]WPK07322.1 VOC family protein [Lysinibacillus capsici]
MNFVTSPLTKKVNNVFIHVRDLRQSAEWYSQLLGLPFCEEKVVSPVYNLPISSETGITLDDHTFDPGFQLQPSKHVLFNFYTNNIDDAYQSMKDKGIPIVRPIERFDDFAYFNIQDLDGNIIMICNG